MVAITPARPDITVPEFCRNPSCPHHHPTTESDSPVWYVRHGYHSTKAHGAVQRFRCTACGTTCSTQTFSIHYWTHRVVDIEHIEKMIGNCAGQRQIGRAIQASGRLVKNRCQRLARNYLAIYAEAACDHLIHESCAFDGFESFVRSQYFPVNMNILIGSETLAVYGVTGSVMRRKGRMTAAQKEFRAKIDAHWKPKRGALLSSCVRLFCALTDRVDLGPRKHPWTLWTDEHQAYPRALNQVPILREALDCGRMRHCTVSSRAARTGRNLLFPVNYIDREIRKDLADHVRETVRFPREMNMAMQRLIIELGSHTFGKPIRISGRCWTETELTHADAAGLTNSIRVRNLMERRYLYRHVHSHAVKRGCAGWISDIWLERYQNPPVVDPVTGEQLRRRVPGSDWRAVHLRV